MSDRHDTRASLDRDRHRALFQRVHQTTQTAAQPTERRPAGGNGHHGPATIYADLLSHLRFHPADLRPAETVYGRGNGNGHGGSALARAVQYLESCGLTREEIVELRLGLYPTCEEVHSHLRRLGYSEAAVSQSGLVCDADGRPRTDWHGCVVAPVCNAAGEVVDVVAVMPAPGLRAQYRFAHGPEASGAAACGLHTPMARPEDHADLILVEDVADALYLQCRGMANVVAVGGCGAEFTPARWEQLSRLGVRSVTLAFREDATRRRDVRDCLEHALRARTTPEVFVFDHDRLADGQTIADVARKHGVAACREAVARRSRAFHGKSFGWSGPVNEPAPRPMPRGAEPVYEPVRYDMTRLDALRAWLHAEAERLASAEDRRAMHDLIADVDDAVRRGHFRLAHDLVESRLGSPRREPAPRTEPVGRVLDRLTRNEAAARVDREFSSHDGLDRQPGTVTVLTNVTRRGRYADLCARLTQSLERWTGTACVVACREFTEEEITLGVVAHMARQMSDGPGLTVEEIRIRIAGRDQHAGYADKPWLVDEAVDCLRQWSDRLRFVAPTATFGELARAVESVAAEQPVGGVFADTYCDAACEASRCEPRSEPGRYVAVEPVESWEALANRHACPVLIVSGETLRGRVLADPPPVRLQTGYPDFATRLHELIEREQGDTRPYRTA
jgi:hypothetical protein